jgi:hypothetical protein
MRVEGVSRVGRKGILNDICWKNLRERDHVEDLGIDGRTILKWIFKK